MPCLKNYHLLISHSWKYSHQYETIVNWLNSTPYFKWSNHSVSADNPFNTESDSELQDRLTRQIQGCSAIIVVSGMYTSYSKWINYEINEARRINKPIIGIKPWGNERVPVKIQEDSTALVNWNSNSLVSAVRDYAL